MNMRNSLILIIYDRVRYLDTGPKLDTEAAGERWYWTCFFLPAELYKMVCEQNETDLDIKIPAVMLPQDAGASLEKLLLNGSSGNHFHILHNHKAKLNLLTKVVFCSSRHFYCFKNVIILFIHLSWVSKRVASFHAFIIIPLLCLYSLLRIYRLLAVSVQLYSPRRPIVDIAEVFLWLMAVGTILCASYWSAWSAREAVIEQDKLLKVTIRCS